MENNIKIKVTDISRLNEQYKEAIQLGTYDGEDVEKFFNTIKLFDIAESSELKKDFSNQYIGFEIITEKEKIPLDAKMDILMQILFDEEERKVYYERYRKNKELDKQNHVIEGMKFKKVDFKKGYKGKEKQEEQEESKEER